MADVITITSSRLTALAARLAMQLTEKGYKVLVLEKGKRFVEEDFAKNNWQF